MATEGKPIIRKEKWVKTQIIKMLKDLGVYYFYPVASGWQSNGVPDIIACINGRFVGIECKAGTNKPSVLQVRNIEAIKANKGVAMVVNEDNLDELEDVLRSLHSASGGY